MKKTAIALVVLALSAACGSHATEPSRFAAVDYTVSGSAARASMTYATSGGGTSQTGDLTLPWTFGTTMSPGDFVYLSAQNGGSSGCVTVEIRVRKTVFKSTQSCGAFVIATVSGTVE